MIGSEYQPDRYIGNDVTTVFAYNFKANDIDHLRVVIADADDDNATVLTKDTHYTYTGVGEDAGGEVTLLDIRSITGEVTVQTLPTDWSITLKLDIPLKQLTKYRNQGAYFAETHEDSFDGLTQIAQQLQEQIDRSLKVSETSGDTGTALDEDLTSIVTEAQAARDAAVVAQTAAETAETNAETAETNAETAETNAVAAKDLAETAQTATEAARDSVVISKHTETAGASQDTITVSGFTLDTSLNNIQIYIDGARIDEFTRTSDTVITLDSALSGGEDILLYSASPSGGGSADVAAHEATYTHITSAITAAGAALLDDADAAAQRTTLGLGTAATSDTGDFVAAGSTYGLSDLDNEVKGVQEDWVFDGACFGSRIAGDDLFENVLKFSMIWDLPNATLVGFDAGVAAADTGAANPSINIEINGTEALSSDLTVSETEAAGTINTSADDITTGQRYEITVATTGTNSDAEDVHVRLLWRVTG
ncbi:hypothetical protein OAG36_01115 [bacterium]|nr:hypothetical protein [bacterium]